MLNEREGLKSMKKEQIKGSLSLFLAAIIWGAAFVAQSVGMDYVGPFTFNCVRTLIGGIVLIPCIAFSKQRKSKEENKLHGEKDIAIRRNLLRSRISYRKHLATIWNHVYNCRKSRIYYSILYYHCSILGLFLGKKCGLSVWISVVIALAGLYFFMHYGRIFDWKRGYLCIFRCNCIFDSYLVIDYFTQFNDGVKMSCIQFFICGILCFVPMMLFEHPEISMILLAWKPILYAGVMSCGVAYTLQIVGQKHMNPTVASLILSLESVISVIAGFFVLHQNLSQRELIGCVLMFIAIILAQLPQKK